MGLLTECVQNPGTLCPREIDILESNGCFSDTGLTLLLLQSRELHFQHFVTVSQPVS